MRSDELLQAVFEEAERRLRVIVREAAARRAKGTQRYYAAQRRKVQAVVRALRSDSAELAIKAVREPYDAAADAASRSLGLEPSFTGVDVGAVRAAAESLGGRLDEAAVTVGRSADDVLRRVVLEEVAQGLARGDGLRSTTAAVRQRLAAEGTVGFVDAAGRRWNLATYAAMAVRTSSREASTAAVVNRVQAAGRDLVRWSHHANPCPVCAPFDGRTFSLSGESKRFPEASLLPPGHPNCRHVLTPAAADEDDDFDAEMGV